MVENNGRTVRDLRVLSRREFLAMTGLGAGALVLGGCGTTAPGGGGPTAGAGRVKEYAFEVAPMEFQLGDRGISTWGYDGGLPGPEIRLKQGETLRARLNNRLPEGTTIHWHGQPIVNDMDGVPDVTQPPIESGEEFTYEFVVPASGTYF